MPRLSNHNLIRLVAMGRWLSDDPAILSGINKVEQLFRMPGHPAKELFRRVIDYLPAQRRIRLFEALFNGAWFEGGEKETDEWRGKGVYRQIMKAFEYLNDARVIIGTSATVTRQNVQVVSSFPFIDQMISLGSMAQMYFMYIPVNGMADFSLMLTPNQRDRLRRQVMAIRNNRPIFALDFWNDGPYVGGCIAGGRRYFHVNAKGDVEPCVFTHIATDNVMEKPLAEALNSPLFRNIRARQPHNPNHLRPCMIIDNPHVMRQVIEEIKPRFTHPGAEEIYTAKKEQMDAYAAKWGELAEQLWREDHGKQQSHEDMLITGQGSMEDEKGDTLSAASAW